MLGRILGKVLGLFGKLPPVVWKCAGVAVLVGGVWYHGYWTAMQRNSAAAVAAAQVQTLPGTAGVSTQPPPDTVFVQVYRNAKALGGKAIAGGTATIAGGTQTGKVDSNYVSATKERIQYLSDSTDWGVLRGFVRAPAAVDSALDVRLTYTRATLKPVFGVYRVKDSTFVSVSNLPGVATEVKGFADVKEPRPQFQRAIFAGYSVKGPAVGFTLSMRLVGPVQLQGIAIGTGRTIATTTGVAATGIAWAW